MSERSKDDCSVLHMMILSNALVQNACHLTTETVMRQAILFSHAACEITEVKGQQDN